MSHLSGKYAIGGIGETEYSRGSGRSTRALGVEAVRNAMLDAGLDRHGINGMLSYHQGDSTPAPAIATDLGVRLDFYMDCSGGGSSTEALVGLAMGAIEAGMCHTVAIFRSMNGYSQMRIGGTGVRAAAPVAGGDLFSALRPDERSPELRPHLHAPYVRVRHYERPGRSRQGRALQARIEQPEGADEAASHP